MPNFELPWAFGPVPIIFTVAAAAVYLQSMVVGTKDDGRQFVSSYLLAVGVVSFIAAIVLPSVGFLIRLIGAQIAIVSIVHFSLFVINWRNGSKTHFQYGGKIETLKKSGIFLAFFIAIDAVCLLPISRQPCTTNKCWAMEDMFGAKAVDFGAIYLGCFTGCIFLFAATVAMINLWHGNLLEEQSRLKNGGN